MVAPQSGDRYRPCTVNSSRDIVDLVIPYSVCHDYSVFQGGRVHTVHGSVGIVYGGSGTLSFSSGPKDSSFIIMILFAH